MRVKCIKNNSELVGNWWKNNSSSLEDILTIDKYYTVYGLIFSENTVYYELLTIHSKYTFSYPSFLFEIVDNRLSKEFCIGTIETGENKIIPFISFKEWVNDSGFYARLVDREDKEVEVFNGYIHKLELEYANPDSKKTAVEIGDSWLQCPECTEVWELECRGFEMCVCPNCKTTLLNPLKVKQVEE